MSAKNAVIIDYGVGNIRSVTRVLESCRSKDGSEVKVQITESLDAIENADLLVLPGVGAFNAASAQLEPMADQIRDLVLNKSRPLIGVCLGMQLLFEKSEEGKGKGLAIFDGEVTGLTSQRVPHMGWNEITYQKNTTGPAWAYFAHSYGCRPSDESIISGTTKYQGDTFPSVIRTSNVLATQFHPEKSDLKGVDLIKDFVSEVL